MPLVSGSVPQLAFEGGRVSVTGGGKRLEGTAQLSGGALTPGALASTRMLCAPAVNTQEIAYLRFLGQAGLGLQVRRETLTLTDTGGQRNIFRRIAAGPDSGAPTGELRPGTYTLATLNGQLAPPTAEPVTPRLGDGPLSGSDGCTTFSAPTSWREANWC